MLAHLKSSPGPATLATTVQRGERVADTDVSVIYHEKIYIILIILMFPRYQEEFIFSSCYDVIVLNCLV